MHHVAGEVLGVDPQVVFVRESQQHRLGSGSQPDGDGGSILDQPRGDQPRNSLGGLDFRGFPMVSSGSSYSTMTSASFMWIKLRPSTRGMRGLT